MERRTTSTRPIGGTSMGKRLGAHRPDPAPDDPGADLVPEEPSTRIPPRQVPATEVPAPAPRIAPAAKIGHTVRLRGLKVFYSEAIAVKGVDIDFAPNKITAIIGPSGCGKSTLVRSI